MVQFIKNVGRNADGFQNNTDNVKKEIIYFDDNDILMENSGGHISNNLVGLSSTLKYDFDETLAGANVGSCEFISCLTSDILNKE